MDINIDIDRYFWKSAPKLVTLLASGEVRGG